MPATDTTDLFSLVAPTASGEPKGQPLSLDPQQRAAARAGRGGALVRAGAGTGKTRTIMARIGFLVDEEGVAPESITVATFTNKAAGEIRARVAAHLGDDVARKIRMGTFHSLGARMLRRHAEKIKMRRNFVVLDDDDARRVLREAMLGGGHAEDGETFQRMHESAFRTIRQWKSWGLTVSEVEDANRARRGAEEERMARVYVSYQHELHRRGMVDFGDLVLMPIEMMEKFPQIADEESEGVVHLLVDEAQDANPAQVMFARLMVSRHYNVFAVGDEDQSIFSFQGGYPGAIRDIVGPSPQEFTLVDNRRCTDEILEPAVNLVSCNRRASPKVLRSGRSGPAPTLTVAGSDREEALKVAERVKAYLDAGAPPGEIAILARSGFAFGTVEEALLKAGIPYDVTGGTSLVDREEVRDVVAYLRLAVEPMDALAFERIANRPVRGLGPQAVGAIQAAHEATGNPFFMCCGALDALGGVRLTSAHRQGLEGLSRALIGLDAACRDEKPSSDILSMILDPQGLDYFAFAGKGKDGGRRKRLENLEAMRRIAVEEPDIWLCMERIALAGEDDTVPKSERVRISTMHSSKGLEWEHVICVGLDMGVIPSPRSLESAPSGDSGDPWDGPRGGGVEEERRLAHVAFTRAKATLDIFVPLSRNGKGTDPSFFLPEAGLDPYLDHDPFAMKKRSAKPGKAQPRFGRKGFQRKT